MKFISDTKWLSLITETYLEGLDAHNMPHNTPTIKQRSKSNMSITNQSKRTS
jgi:hypothetical protein